MPSDNDRLLMMSKGKIVGCGCLIIVIYLVLLMMCRLQSPESYVMEYLDRGAWRWGIVSVIFQGVFLSKAEEYKAQWAPSCLFS